MSFVQYMLFLCVNYIKCFSKEIWWIIMCKYFLYWFEFKHHLFMGHMVSSLLFLKQRIFFFMCILKTIFPKTVFPKTCFVFPIFIGGEACFLTFVIHWGVVTLHREGCLYFLWSWIVLCSLNSLFSLDFCCVCFLFILCLSCLC